ISFPIERVRPPAARPGRTLLLEGSFPPLAGDEGAESRAQIVFASPGGAPMVARAIPKSQREGKTSELEVTVPPGASSGWIGLSDDDLIDKANAHRADVRAWLAELADEPCLRGSSIP